MVSNSLQFVGTATTVLQYGGFTVLTDPNFLHRGDLAYLHHGLFTRRLTEPALTIEQLPPIDAVVLSHLHGDHFDRVAKAGLSKDLPILTTRQAARRLRLWGFSNAIALETWETQEMAKGDSRLRITAAPGRHHSSPAIAAVLPQVMGSILEFSAPDGPLSVYITGDTMVYEGLREIQRRCPDLDLGLWHLGGTRVLGLLVTMDARLGADLLEMIRPRMTVPIHYDDYAAFKSPVKDFLDEVQRRGLPGVWPIARGEVLELASGRPVERG